MPGEGEIRPPETDSVQRCARNHLISKALFRIYAETCNLRECVVDDPVHYEPVSATNSLLTGKNTGKLARVALGGGRVGPNEP